MLKLKGFVNKKCRQKCNGYAAECWTLKVEYMQRLKSTEMRMLRMICGEMLKDKVSSDNITIMTDEGNIA